MVSKNIPTFPPYLTIPHASLALHHPFVTSTTATLLSPITKCASCQSIMILSCFLLLWSHQNLNRDESNESASPFSVSLVYWVAPHYGLDPSNTFLTKQNRLLGHYIRRLDHHSLCPQPGGPTVRLA